MTQRHGIYSVPLPISGKKVAANVVTLAACLLLPKKMHLEKPCGPMDSSFYAICIFVFLRFF